MLTGCGTLLATFETDTIDEDPGKRTIAQQIEDESIETKAIVNIRALDSAFDEANLVAVAYNGFVLVAGQVSKQDLKDQVPNVLRKIAGVRRIYNELEVRPNASTEVHANDVWLTTQVKSKLLITSDTPSTRVKVVTENSVVYLMGLLTPEEADRVADVAASINGVSRVVRLFELI
jgi:osmotically-inducible protein OsmY